MKFTAYKTNGCFYCTQLDKLFERANIKYESILVGDDIEKEEFLKTYPDMKGYPLVIVDGIPIGGLVETAKFMLDHGLVRREK